MSDTEQPPVPPAAPEPVGPPASPATRFRDRVFGLRAVVAVGAAGVILGGLAGFGIHAATDGDGHDGRMGRFGPGGFPGRGPGQGPGQGGPWQQGPPGQQGPGQPGPGQPPQDS